MQYETISMTLVQLMGLIDSMPADCIETVSDTEGVKVYAKKKKMLVLTSVVKRGSPGWFDVTVPVGMVDRKYS